MQLLCSSIFSLKHNLLVISTISRKGKVFYFLYRLSLELSHYVALWFRLQLFKRSWAFKLLFHLRLQRNSTCFEFGFSFLFTTLAANFRCFSLQINFLRLKKILARQICFDNRNFSKTGFIVQTQISSIFKFAIFFCLLHFIATFSFRKIKMQFTFKRLIFMFLILISGIETLILRNCKSALYVFLSRQRLKEIHWPWFNVEILSGCMGN